MLLPGQKPIILFKPVNHWTNGPTASFLLVARSPSQTRPVLAEELRLSFPYEELPLLGIVHQREKVLRSLGRSTRTQLRFTNTHHLQSRSKRDARTSLAVALDLHMDLLPGTLRELLGETVRITSEAGVTPRLKR